MDINIQEYLKKEYNNFVSEYGKKHILGTFVVGKANYGYIDSLQDIQFITIYIPSFEELCLHSIDQLKHNKINTTLGKIVDIRKLYQATMKPDSVELELLFSQYSIITGRYKTIFEEKLLNKREDIARFNPRKRLDKSLKRAKQAYDNNDYFEVLRLSIASRLYVKGHSCNECYHITDPIYVQYLNAIKRKAIIPSEEEILSAIDEIEHLKNSFEDKNNYSADAALKSGIVALITESLKDNITLDAFLNCLTKTEKKAFKYLKNIYLKDGESYISISSLIDETKISRITWDNLFKKMTSNNIAMIKNHGVKGTEIKINEEYL